MNSTSVLKLVIPPVYSYDLGLSSQEWGWVARLKECYNIGTTHMTILEIILSIGIPTIVIALIYIGRKLQILDSVEKTVDSIYDRFIKTEERVETLWKDKVAPAHSPRRLNEYGQKILAESSIKEIIDEKKGVLLEIIKKQDIKNAYDAEQAILSVAEELTKHCPDIIDKLKTGAFNAGASLDTVLLVGGIYLRDLVFPDLGFSVEQIDK